MSVCPRFFQTVAALGGALVALPASAIIFSPSQSDLLAITDVTGDFSGGGSLFDATLDGSGVLYDFDFAPGTDGISRVVLENTAPTVTDLTGFDSFDILFEPQSFNLGVKSYIRTGEDGFFETVSEQVALNANSRISLDLSTIPNLDDVRGFGLQIFDPQNGTSFATLARVETAPEPIPTVEDQLFSFETGRENWGLSFQGDTTHAIDTTHATDGTQSLRITRELAEGQPAFTWGTEFYLNADPTNGDVNADPSIPRGIVNATQTEVDDFAARFVGGSSIAFDVIIDTAELSDTTSDGSDPFIGVGMFLNDETGDFWSTGNGQFFLPADADGVHTVEWSYETLTGSGSGGDGSAFSEFDPITQIVRFGVSTNTNVAGSIFIDNIRIISEVDGEVFIDGDYNGDGFVSQADLDLVLLNWGAAVVPAEWLATDQFDGVQVSQNELDGVLLNWGSGTPPAGVSAIPEPATLGLLTLGGLALSGRQRRRH